MSVQEAAAICAPGVNNLVCNGASPSPAPFSATADGFAVGIGSFIPSEAPAFITVQGLTVNAGAFDGTITETPASTIIIANDGNAGTARHGLIVNATNPGSGPNDGVNVNINGLIRSNDTYNIGFGFLASGADAVRLAGNGSSIFKVNVGATTGNVDGGAGSNGINVVNAASVHITNAGTISGGTASTTVLYTPLGQTGNAIRIGETAPIAGSATIDNTGLITGVGAALGPVIYGNSIGGVVINNNLGGRIVSTASTTGDPLDEDDDLVIGAVGGTTAINNRGTIEGRMDFSLGGGAVTFTNYSDTTWNTSGITNFSNDTLVGDLEDNAGGTTNTTGLFANINFLAGDDILRNRADPLNSSNVGDINLDAAGTLFTFGQGNDLMENLEGSHITATNLSAFAFDDVVPDLVNIGLFTEVGLQGADTFRNADGSTFTGAVSTTFVFGGNGAVVGAQDKFINTTRATFTVDGLNIFDMGSGDDLMRNSRGAEFTATGINSFQFGAGADRFVNTRGAGFTLNEGSLLALNTMDFGDGDDSFRNSRGADFRADGINTIINLETMTNTRGADIEFNGLTFIGDDNTSGLTSLTNTRGASFEIDGVALINFTGAANTFDNTRGANFDSYGFNFMDFGGDTDTINNTQNGFIYAGGTPGLDLGIGAGALTFLNLERFNGAGGGTGMQDGDVWDGIVMVGTEYNVDGDNADHWIDAELGGPISLGDILHVGSVIGDGTTYVHVNDIDNGPGEYNQYGIAIVGVEDGSAEIDDFRLADGPIEKGFFTYDIYLNHGNSPFHPKCGINTGEDCFVIASVAGARTFELPVIQYGANQMWHTSTGTWTDRTTDLRTAFGSSGAGGGGADAVIDPIVETAVANVTPGIWGRAFGATQSRDNNNTSAPPPDLDGFDAEFNGGFNQGIYGFMGGIDFGREGVTDKGNQAWIFGIMAGYTGSNLDFDNTDTEVDYQAGSIGAYVTYLNGGLFVDGIIKADFGNIDYSADGDSADTDYTSIGGVIDGGYRINMASGWFVEPKATLAYVSTDFDDLTVLGPTVSFDDGDSLRGRLGARVGTTVERPSGNLIEPYIEASVWNEFDGDYSASFVSAGTPFTPTFDADGVFGEVALGASVVNIAKGWSGFARGAVQFGDDSMVGFTGNLGVRKNW